MDVGKMPMPCFCVPSVNAPQRRAETQGSRNNDRGLQNWG